MIFPEWVKKYGINSAKSTYGLSDHMFFNVVIKEHGGVVYGRCGRWVGSEPLYHQTWQEAIEKLKSAVNHQFKTHEIRIQKC